MKKNILSSLLLSLLAPISVTLFRKRRERAKLKRSILNDSDDYKLSTKNIVDSISKSKSLYKELITSVHPDKFQEIEQKNKATELASRITKSKKNYNDLVELKIEVSEFLKN
jgi:DnaJ-domain-containing protein 1